MPMSNLINVSTTTTTKQQLLSSRAALLLFSRRGIAHQSPPSSSVPQPPPHVVEERFKNESYETVKSMLARWKKDPSAVHSSWAECFKQLENVAAVDSYDIDHLTEAYQAIASANSCTASDNKGATASDPSSTSFSGASSRSGHGSDNGGFEDFKESARILNMVKAFQARGHLIADIDPLKLPRVLPFVSHARFREQQRFGEDFTLRKFGFTEAEEDRLVTLKIPGRTGFLGHWNLDDHERLSELAGKYVADLPSDHEALKPLSIKQLFKRLEETYCGSIGLEFVHITDTDRVNFLRNLFETPRKYSYSTEMKRKILNRTVKAVLFETFAAAKFATMKRFGLDGCESMIVGMKSLTKLATLLGVESIVIGMAHRGRLNTLHNIMNKPAYQVFSEFSGNLSFGGYDWGNLGDVKYHMGVEYEYVDNDHNKHVLMSVLPNPSHLEAVDPVVLGTARARQTFKGDKDGSRVLPVLIHGDASVSGQGVVYETVQMSDVPAYKVGGTIHIVINNQIGFTTNTCDSGSGLYCTDLAKAINAPILHVNADDPEAVTYVMEVAVKYRQKFKSDIFIDLVGYRRFGHNELDMPKFTQPRMYDKISKHPNVLEIYGKRLVAEKVISEKDLSSMCNEVLADYEAAYKKGKAFKPSKTLRPFSPQWHGMAAPDQVCAPRLSGLPEETVRNIGRAISTIPSHIEPHPTIARIYKARLDALDHGDMIDFGLAEALAFGSLLRDGYHVRIAGQDAQRGTFSHRHAAIHDQKTGRKYFPLAEFAKQRHYRHGIEIYNSTLSEYACMGFEYGWSLENPNSLNIWEAQFGDFANGAQIIIDQFIASGEVKWLHPSGLVLLLPHGYDGQGPEHSSARIERFLSLADDREDVIHPEFWNVKHRSVIQKHNMQVVNCSTAANFFHVLRRQMHRGFRKPLVVFSPKKLLRLRESMSPISEFTDGTRFQRMMADPLVEPIPNQGHPNVTQPGTGNTQNVKKVSRSGIKRMVVCSGQVYYDLVKQRAAEKLEDKVVIVRIEQLSPFPLDALADQIKTLPDLQSVVWCQEEPMNQGPWTYVSRRIDAVLNHCQQPNGIAKVIYAGRDVAASPAVGDPRLHMEELSRLCKDAIDLDNMRNSYLEKYL